MGAVERGAVEARCRACGGPFIFDPAFYAEHGLTSPSLCCACRDERKARLITISAVVVKVTSTYIFARGSDTERYFIAPACVPVDTGELRLGDEVLVDVDPLARVEPGHRPRALRVRRP